MESQQRSALVFCDEGLSQAIRSSAGQVRIEVAVNASELFAILSKMSIDIVVLPWVASEKDYSVARSIKRLYPTPKLVFFDEYANHPLSRRLLDELGFSFAPTISTRVLAGFFEDTMVHLFPEIFAGSYLPILLEFTEFDISLHERLSSRLEAIDVRDQAVLESELVPFLQSFGYEIDLLISLDEDGIAFVAGGKPLSPDRYLYALLVRMGFNRGRRVEAVSKLLFQGASSYELSCVAIIGSPSSGIWGPFSELECRFRGEAREALKEWLDKALGLFIRNLTLRYFKASRLRDLSGVSGRAFKAGRWRPSVANPALNQTTTANRAVVAG